MRLLERKADGALLLHDFSYLRNTLSYLAYRQQTGGHPSRCRSWHRQEQGWIWKDRLLHEAGRSGWSSVLLGRHLLHYTDSPPVLARERC